MTETSGSRWGSLRTLFRAFACWLASALLLCFLAACIIRAQGIASSGIAYISSALSFLCAMAAGAACAQERGGRGEAFVCALFLCLALLSAGFVIEGREMEASGILSVVSFTVSGCLLGSLLFRERKKATKRNDFQRKRKQNR